jgi:hypothetical protein
MAVAFAVDELRLLPVWGNFLDFSSKIIKEAHFSFGSMGLSFAVDEMGSLPVLDNFLGFFFESHQRRAILVLIRESFVRR